jgi:hypothetical protein
VWSAREGTRSAELKTVRPSQERVAKCSGTLRRPQCGANVSDAKAKVTEWLAKQGFPLEFKTAEVFARNGFETDQGAYITDPVEGTLREIDVIASTSHHSEGRRYRFSILAECKWSRDKPWVIFTSRRARPTLAASVAYLLGSSFAEAILWFLAGDQQIIQAHRNAMPLRVGFGGRQAFTEKNDKEQFYPAIQGVVAAATAFAREHDTSPTSALDLIREFRVVIPTIVLDGLLFEAFLEGEELKVEPLVETTVSWRGFGVRQQPAFVNVVTVDALPEYAEKHVAYGENLRYWAKPLAEQVAKAAVSKDARDLPPNVNQPAGIAIPWLLSGMVG